MTSQHYDILGRKIRVGDIIALPGTNGIMDIAVVNEKNEYEVVTVKPIGKVYMYHSRMIKCEECIVITDLPEAQLYVLKH